MDDERCASPVRRAAPVFNVFNPRLAVSRESAVRKFVGSALADVGGQGAPRTSAKADPTNGGTGSLPVARGTPRASVVLPIPARAQRSSRPYFETIARA